MATAKISNQSSSDGGGVNQGKADPMEREVQLRGLRRFHLTCQVPGGTDDTIAGNYLPALLGPLRQAEEVSHDYPLFLYPEEHGPEKVVCSPVGKLLRDAVDGIAESGGETSLLEKNLKQVDRSLRHLLAAETRPLAAAGVLERLKENLSRELKLKDEEEKQFHDEFDALTKVIPQDGSFLGFSSQAPIHLFLTSVRAARHGRREVLRNEVSDLMKKVRDLLEIEKSKDPKAREAEGLRDAVGGTTDELIDAEAMSMVIGKHRGSGVMDHARRERIQAIEESFSAFLESAGETPIRIVHDGSLESSLIGDVPDAQLVEDPDPCGGALRECEESAGRKLGLFRAIRVATLEVENKYDPAYHDSWFERFDSDAFSNDEMAHLPMVAAIDSADRIAREGMLSFSRLLRSPFPAHLLVPIRPVENPGGRTDGPSHTGSRLEIGYIGMSQREAWVDQSSAARPEHLTRSFIESLAGSRPALHVYASGLEGDGHAPRLNTWLHAGIELEGRAHSFFRYNPEAGTTWARRLEFGGNPQADLDWPEYSLGILDGEGQESEITLPFTFADFVVLEKDYARHFHLIPDSLHDDRLVDIGRYLEGDADGRADQIPFIRAVDIHGDPARLAVTRRLADDCRDRRNFWISLQELAGARNQYALDAAAAAREEALVEGAAERENLQAAHDEKLNAVRDEIVDNLVHGLTSTLTGDETFDFGAAVASLVSPSADAGAEGTAAPVTETAKPVPLKPAPPGIEKAPVEPVQEAPPAKAPTVETPAAAEEPPAPAPVEEDEVEEAWVDSEQCTTCNECLNINDALFVYDDNDQCVIGDPKAGTYDEMVRAAECCPVGIIHPGTPLNPDEPNLVELKKRAAAFD